MENSTLFNCCTDHAAPDWSQFTGLEVGGCTTETDERTGDTFTNGGEDRADAEFFTIYGRMSEDGCEAITDCQTFELAETVAAHLSGLSGLSVSIYC